MNRIHRSAGLRSSTTLLQATTAEEQREQTSYGPVELELRCAALLPPCGRTEHLQSPGSVHRALQISVQTQNIITAPIYIYIYFCSSLWKSMVHVPQFLASINLLTLIYQAVNYTQCDSHAMTALYLNDANVISSHYGKFNQSDFFLYIFFLVKQVHLCIFRSRRASHWLLSFAI